MTEEEYVGWVRHYRRRLRAVIKVLQRDVALAQTMTPQEQKEHLHVKQGRFDIENTRVRIARLNKAVKAVDAYLAVPLPSFRQVLAAELGVLAAEITA